MCHNTALNSAEGPRKTSTVSISIRLVTIDAHHFSNIHCGQWSSLTFHSFGNSVDFRTQPEDQLKATVELSTARFTVKEEHDPHCHFPAKSQRLQQRCVQINHFNIQHYGAQVLQVSFVFILHGTQGHGTVLTLYWQYFNGALNLNNVILDDILRGMLFFPECLLRLSCCGVYCSEKGSFNVSLTLFMM